MDLVYKYCDNRGLAILESCTLKITPPVQFNDPFEFTAQVEGSVPRRQIKKLVSAKDQIHEAYYEEKRAGRFTGNFRLFRKKHREVKKPIVDLLIAHASEVRDHIQLHLLSGISRSIGVLCLSECKDNILMWGHYGNSHTGLVIGFDSQHSFFKQQRGLRKVLYVNTRPVYNVGSKMDKQERDDLGVELALSKSTLWQYERELRQLFLLSRLESKRDSAGEMLHFAKIEPALIKSITLGMRASSETKSRLRELISQERWKHVQVDTMRLHGAEFALTTHKGIV